MKVIEQTKVLMTLITRTLQKLATKTMTFCEIDTIRVNVYDSQKMKNLTNRKKKSIATIMIGVMYFLNQNDIFNFLVSFLNC